MMMKAIGSHWKLLDLVVGLHKGMDIEELVERGPDDMEGAVYIPCSGKEFKHLVCSEY